MLPNTLALVGALQAEKAKANACCTGDAAEWCRVECKAAVRHG